VERIVTYKEALMGNRSWTTAVIRSLVCIMMAGAACASPPPVVKATCAIAWDRSADYLRVAEYRLMVWKGNEDQASLVNTHVVKAPSTEVSCQDIGANTSGRWQVTVQACLSDGTCSQAGKPITFQVAEN
jgi:hypothetical protein